MIKLKMGRATESSELRALAKNGIVSVQIVRQHHALGMYQDAVAGDPEARRIFPMVLQACEYIAGGSCICAECGKGALHKESFVLLVCEPDGGADYAESVHKSEPLGAVLPFCQGCASTDEKAVAVVQRLCAKLWPDGRLLPPITHKAGHA